MRPLVLVPLVAACTAGQVAPPPDVRGNYDLTYSDTLTLKLNVAGAVRERTANGYGEIVDFGEHQGQPVTLDLAQFCAREDVHCPSEAFWRRVAIDQPNIASRHVDAYVLNVIDDTVHSLPAGERAKVVAGFVTRPEHRFVVGLGSHGQSNESCALLAVSLAGGRFSHEGERVETTVVHRTPEGRPCEPSDAGTEETDAGVPACAPVEQRRLTWPEGAFVSGIAEGRIGTAYLGGCAFGPLLVGATLTIETTFTGVRTGLFDPPPFTPLEPDPELEPEADGP